MSESTWRPLLEGDLARQAWEAVDAIAAALEAEPPLPEDSPGGPGREASLAGGKAGQALFHAYLAESGRPGAERQAELAERFLDEAIETLASTPMPAGLYSGFAGVAWAAEHLVRMGEKDIDDRKDSKDSKDEEAAEEEGGDINEEIDGALLGLLEHSPWQDQYDLISGLVGYGVYAVERFPKPSGVRCLEAVIDRLDDTAERNERGATWFTPPEMLPPDNRERTPNGYYNLGVAHGVPGVIALLADACHLGVREERARPLLEGAVRWLLSQRLPEGAGGCYAFATEPGVEPKPSRLAWCYGDPGIAATLLYAARRTGNPDWEREALAVATSAAQAPLEAAGVRDTGLCHGALGLAHIFNRIFQASGGEVYAEAARFWYRQGLEMRHPDRGVAGFPSFQPMKGADLQWQDDPGFLTGATGIGLAYLAALTPVEPEWDRVLQVAIPPC